MKTLLLLALLTPALALAQIYKSTDEDGNIIYTDIPPDDSAKEVVLPELNVLDTPKTTYAPKKVAPENQSKPKSAFENKYTQLEIIQPSHEETIRDNAGNVILSVQLIPRLFAEKGDRLFIELDGQVVNNGTSNTVKLDNIDRGTHTVAAYIQDADGEQLIVAENISFELKRFSKAH
ncbi:MAG: DUF4124 domain-containing protein [Gammaproteobacteria bacterium]|nr:DUF4124 domain-containing protein [Gammaproteobacteria bacterium]